MSGLKRRSTRQAASRKRSIYAEPDTDDDFEIDSEAEYQPEEPQPPTLKKRKTSGRGHKPQTRSKVKNKQQTVRAAFKIGKPRKPNSKGTSSEKSMKRAFNGPSDSKTPDWLSLPVNILREIFVFASREDTAEAGANVTWLLRCARTCRALALPALEAYYNSPAILSTLHPHCLLDLLEMPKDRRYIDYNVKIRSLVIDVKFLAYVATHKPPFDLVPLIAQLPQLQDMEIIHPMYQPPYRPLKIQRWTYPPLDLLQAMEQHSIRLKTWRWSRDMIPKNAFLDLYGTLMAAHQSKAFETLTRLVVCGFNYEDSSEPMAESADELSTNAEPAASLPGLATSIAKLPSLRDLTFISCDVVMDKFLQRLPLNLQRLELSNCLEITSDMLRTFFKTSGSSLQELVLNHNAALNLSFLCNLKEWCPRLEMLKVDLHYYSERFTVNDAIALYDELLSIDEIPTWPATLRHLEIVHAQKWSPEAAQNLFRSLIDGAPDLLDLRILILHAHINIPWRDRVGFRDQCIERLRRVYLRRPEEPVKHLGSLKQFRLWKQGARDGMAEHDADELGHDHTVDAARPITRQLSHVQVSPHKHTGDTDVDSDSDDAPLAAVRRQPRRSRRVAASQVSQTSKSATPAVESDSEQDSDDQDWRKQPEKFIQGLCNVVDVRIDNQRPRENQWTEGDFLDSEVSGDEDWHEGADSGAEETYAW